jgi:hypothetical protein
MKHLPLLALVCVLALVSAGCRVVTSENYVLRSGETLSSDLTVSGGDARLEPGSRVTGSLLVTGGSVDSNGQIDGDISVTGGSIDANGQIGGNVSVTGGSINFGSAAVVRGVVRKIGGGVNITPGAQVRYAESSSPARTIGNIVVAFGLIPLLLIAVVVFLLVTRTSRGTATQVPTGQPTGDAVPTPSSSGISSLAEKGTGLGGSVVLAVILIGLGILFLFQELLNVDVWHYAWPYLVIVAGLLCFAAMVLGGKSSGRLAISGSIVTVVGLILLYQNTFDAFESWAYAWALIFPTAYGIGRYIQGRWSDRPDLREKGIQETRTGLIIFVILAAFFELVLNLSGYYSGDLGRYLFPVLLILIGVLLLFGRFLNLPGPRHRPA